MSRVLVIGESCKDVFIYGDVSRLNPEAPVPIITPIKTIFNNGMSSNVVDNLKSLGITDIIHITNDYLFKKTRYVDESYNYILLRIDENESVERINLDILPDSSLVDYIIISDYNKGFLENSDIEYICKKYDAPIFIDTKKPIGDWICNVSYIKINNTEYQKNKKYIDSNLDIKTKTIITKGRYGCVHNGIQYPTQEVLIKDVVGAGDTFLAGLVFSYIQTNSIDQSIKYANKCSAQVVQRRGVGIINKEEL